MSFDQKHFAASYMMLVGLRCSAEAFCIGQSFLCCVVTMYLSLCLDEISCNAVVFVTANGCEGLKLNKSIRCLFVLVVVGRLTKRATCFRALQPLPRLSTAKATSVVIPTSVAS